MFCPAQITITHNDDTERLINLNVCSHNGPLMSVDSNSPVIIPAVTAMLSPSVSYYKFQENSTSYTYLSAKEDLRPPIS